MRTKNLVYCALFTAVIAIMSQIVIPVQPVPLNMALLAVILAGGILGKKYGTLSVVVYILLGTAGVPVFAGFRGGFGVLAGPTGGFIIGYILVAFITGAVFEKIRKTRYVLSFMLLAVILCYAVGVLWYWFVMKCNFTVALTACVLPFIVGDIVKILIALIITNKYKKMIF